MFEDKETIIRGLQACLYSVDCPSCPYADIISVEFCKTLLVKDTINLIKQYEAETERLKPFEKKGTNFSNK